MHRARQRPAFGLLSQAEQIIRELRRSGKIAGVSLPRPTLISGPFREAILGGEFLPDEIIDARILRPKAQRRRPGRSLGRDVVAQMRHHCPIGPRIRLDRIRGDDFRDKLLRPLVILGINAAVGQLEQTRDVLGIDLQRRIQRSGRDLAIAALVSASAAGMEIGVVGQNFQTGFKRFRRERKIVFLQRQLAPREINIAQLRVGLLRDREDTFQHVLRVSAQQQRRTSKHHQVRRLTIGPGPSSD